AGTRAPRPPTAVPRPRRATPAPPARRRARRGTRRAPPRPRAACARRRRARRAAPAGCGRPAAEQATDSGRTPAVSPSRAVAGGAGGSLAYEAMRVSRTLALSIAGEIALYTGIGFLAFVVVMLAQNLAQRLPALAAVGFAWGDVFRLLWVLMPLVTAYSIPVGFLFGVL